MISLVILCCSSALCSSFIVCLFVKFVLPWQTTEVLGLMPGLEAPSPTMCCSLWHYLLELFISTIDSVLWSGKIQCNVSMQQSKLHNTRSVLDTRVITVIRSCLWSTQSTNVYWLMQESRITSKWSCITGLFSTILPICWLFISV